MTGVLIIKLVKGSPLEKAGLFEGDLIVACNRKKVHDFEQLMDIIAGLKESEAVELEVHDDSKERKYTIRK